MCSNAKSSPLTHTFMHTHTCSMGGMCLIIIRFIYIVPFSDPRSLCTVYAHINTYRVEQREKSFMRSYLTPGYFTTHVFFLWQVACLRVCKMRAALKALGYWRLFYDLSKRLACKMGKGALNTVPGGILYIPEPFRGRFQ